MAERQPIRNVPDLNLQALLREVERLFDQKLEPIQDRLDHVEGRAQRRRTPLSPPRNRGRQSDVDDESSESNEHESRSDPEAYLEWEKKIELIFECHNYSETKKVKLAAIKFSDYAMVWWDQLTTSRRRNGERLIQTWSEMKAVMRRHFIPSYYHRELYQKLQNLTQGTRSVEDYFKEMEVAMISADVEEDREATMARFLAELNREIANIVELQHYVEIVDMVHMAIKVEKQLKMKGAVRGYSSSNASKWNQGTSKNVSMNQSKEIAVPMKSNKSMVESSKGKAIENTQSRTRDIKCFKCQGRGHIASQCSNRNTMIMLPNGEIESEDEVDKNEEEVQHPSENEEEVEFAVEGEMLVVKRSLSAQSSIGEPQRENLFHTRCYVHGKVCSIVINGGSCTNVASTLMIEKLSMPTLKHPSPYKLQWLNEGVELKVTKQAMIPFSIGKYQDEILCDVVPMHAGHLLLGRPWQFDRRVKHDGFSNQYSFKHKGKNVTLAPLSPQQVMDDQQRIKQSLVKPSKELRLHYIPEERRFILREYGKTDPQIHNLKDRQGLVSEELKTSLSCSKGDDIREYDKLGSVNEHNGVIHEATIAEKLPALIGNLNSHLEV
ncbi:uncharacterized protein LOC128036160 [Gossypium raimondii]|uniref:uncharacterized protein LOC128036160 n=1 Tax=Gossypium raimondii TaxID=29730 RepID=UPI00227AC6DB|nr:uncharacterized protein LOC128036160 [Gossypium raimondii]